VFSSHKDDTTLRYRCAVHFIDHIYVCFGERAVCISEVASFWVFCFHGGSGTFSEKVVPVVHDGHAVVAGTKVIIKAARVGVRVGLAAGGLVLADEPSLDVVPVDHNVVTSIRSFLGVAEAEVVEQLVHHQSDVLLIVRAQRSLAYHKTLRAGRAVVSVGSGETRPVLPVLHFVV